MVLLVRYGELSLKSRYVRRQLEDRLVANVQAMFAAHREECVVRRERGRLFVHADDESPAARLLRRVFGITSVSPAEETSSELGQLTTFVTRYAGAHVLRGTTFAIRPRRSGEHPYTSQELARVLGQAVRDAIPGVSVDLETPDRTINVEVRGPRAYVFHQVVDGPGGLPIGSQGEVLAAAEDEAGMVATWLVMRRGCRARLASREPYLAALRAWDPGLHILEKTTGKELLRLAAEKHVPLVLASRVDVPISTTGPFVIGPLDGLSTDEIAALAQRIRDV